MYKKAEASFWKAEELDDFAEDLHHWNHRLNDNERFFIKHVLAFFASADGIVNENLASRFMVEVQLAEARQFYGFQIAMENIHQETYALLIDTFVPDREERAQVFRAIETMECIKGKTDWALNHITNASSFGERLIAFAAVEGIFFSGAFCSIFWLRKRGLMPTLSFSNWLISRDEGLHTDFACLLLNLLWPHQRPPQQLAHGIIGAAVALEHIFVQTSLPVELIGMNAALMCQYVEYMADRLLLAMGYERLFHASNPFDWMVVGSLDSQVNFFERRNDSYKQGAMNDNRTFSTTEKC